MERLTQEEWQEVLHGLEARAALCWQMAAEAYDCDMGDIGDRWARRVVVCKTAYHTLFTWPWEPEPPRLRVPDYTRDVGTQAWMDAFGEGSVS